jgi:hypothetical protein
MIHCCQQTDARVAAGAAEGPPDGSPRRGEAAHRATPEVFAGEYVASTRIPHKWGEKQLDFAKPGHPILAPFPLEFGFPGHPDWANSFGRVLRTEQPGERHP